MQKISIIIGILGLVGIGWFLVHESSIDYVATVDDELSKLEMQLATLDADGLSGADAAVVKTSITNRLGTINASLEASQDRTLNVSQQRMLDDGLVRLQQLLLEHQATLAKLDQPDGAPVETSEGETIIALTETIGAIKDYLGVSEVVLADSPRNARYVIDDIAVELVDGVAVTQVAPDSEATATTTYFGNEVLVDLDLDGREDVVFLVTQSRGGSGTFFYVVAALQRDNGWEGSAGYLLGDRIAPQSTELSHNPSHENVIVINYAERAEGEPMTSQPSVGVSVWLKLDLGQLTWGDVEQDFAGEADPDRMTLTMKPWSWIQTAYSDGRLVKPKTADDFVMTFTADGSVSITTDCNSMGGSYETDESQLTFGPLMSTKMFCEDSLEQPFAVMLEQTQSYYFTTKGELILELQSASGSVVFK